MLKDERLKEIETMLQTNGKVEVGNLCRIFNVTEMTIRRDLNDLVARNLAVGRPRGAGGAPGTKRDRTPQAKTQTRQIRITRNLREKEAIAREALQFIGDGDRVFFDSSTTVYCLARLISNTQKFLAVTDTLSTAMELNARTSLRVVCLGGELKKTTGSCTGTFAEQMLKSMYFNTVFIGLPRISKTGVLSTSSMSELSIKRAAIDHASQVIVLADSSKIGEPDFLAIGNLSEVDVLITDSKIPADFVRYCESIGVRTIIAQAPPV